MNFYRLVLISFFLFVVQFTKAQVLDSPSKEDLFFEKTQSAKIDTLISQAKASEIGTQNMGEIALYFAKQLSGIPYLGGTLDRLPDEQLIVRLDSLDCVTFVENVLALTQTLKSPMQTFETFKRKLEFIRYRGGKRQGYASRLHYFCDWIKDNELKNNLIDITSLGNSVEFKKPIDFMSTHRKLYTHLSNDSIYNQIITFEDSLSRQHFSYLPKDNLQNLKDLVKNGDILAITSTISGIDINHVGFVSVKGEKVYMIHASSTGHNVELTHKPLAEYLAGIKKDTGLMVLRINELP